MNSFESASTETQQEQREQKETPPTSPIDTHVPAPETKQEEARAPVASTPKVDELVETEAAPQYTGNLSYSCLLIPRFSDHYLSGDITEYLVEWMKEICVSYGWRLDAIAVRPGYMQWVMTVPLNANPAQFMRIARRHTSGKIFDEFPRYKQKNLSGAFWAPGNFVMPGNQIQTPETVNNFILQTRRHQGITF